MRVSIVRLRSWRVGAVVVDRHAEHARLLAQLHDRVDLAVVAEHAEGLDALEGGPGVGRVAVVAEQPTVSKRSSSRSGKYLPSTSGAPITL